MNNRIDAIYTRQSVDRANSISIESQIEFCRYELKGGNYKEFIDRGLSGKDTVRPQFQQLVRDIKNGLISKVVVYKLDRISRSVLDFSNLMELFQKYKVDFVSTTEKFDTSTPMGRAMLNICIVFAQLERETIQKRVSDAFYSRSRKGLRMGGKAPYGYELEPTVMQGIHTKKLVANPQEAEHVRLMFEMYAEPKTSYRDIARYFAKKGILFYGKTLTSGILSQLLRNPVYAQADLDIYEFFKSQGTSIVNDATDFTGMNGCYLYQGKDAQNKLYDLKGQTLVLAPHEAIIPSDLWLKCRRKLMNNVSIQPGRKPKNTWLAGKIKCGRCGYALMYVDNSAHVPYFRCTKRANSKTCVGCGTLRVTEFEAFIYGEMVRKLQEFQILTGENTAAKSNPKLTALHVELAKVENEIENLLDTLTGANAVLLSYANSKIEELDGRKQSLIKDIADMTAETVSPEQIEWISGYLNNWDNVSFDDRRQVVDGLISRIGATSEKAEIQWKI